MGVKLSEDENFKGDFKVRVGAQISAFDCDFQISFQLFRSDIYISETYVTPLAKK
jgi:hypothetical protein